MIRVITLIALFVTTTMSAQLSSNDEVKVTIETFFEGFHKGDTVLMKSVMADKILLQTAVYNKEGKSVLLTEDVSELTEAIANRPKNQKWDERLLNFNIQVDGNMANAWTPYEFWYNGEFSHCGVNSFQLFNDNGKWKIIYLIDTRRKEGCQN